MVLSNVFSYVLYVLVEVEFMPESGTKVFDVVGSVKRKVVD